MKRILLILCTMLVCMNFSSCMIYRDRPPRFRSHKTEKQKKPKPPREPSKPPRGYGY